MEEITELHNCSFTDVCAVIKSAHLAEYNATDQTFNVANSQALGKYLLQSGGVELIKHSYILVVDHSVPVIERKYNDRGNVSGIEVCTYAIGNLYKLDIEDSDFQKVYDCWIYPDDSPEVKESKMKAWDRLDFTLWNIKNVGTLCLESQEASMGNAPDENALVENSITKCARELIDELEKSGSDWQVKSGIYKTNPVSAKIGKKEGLSNMDRYEVLEFISDGYGHNYSRRRGWIRATKVVDKRNLRNLCDMSRQRMCSRAYWEYRQMFKDIYNALSEYSEEWKTITEMCFHPKCAVTGYCIEKNSCGMMPKA